MDKESDLAGTVAALGNFDGVHLGHQAMLAHAMEAAQRLGARATVVVFEPHPRAYFQPNQPAFRLQSNLQRKRALAQRGFSSVHALAFDAALAALSPEAFVREVLVGRLGLCGVVVGEDFRFGAGRTGDGQDLARLAAEANLQAFLAPLLSLPGGLKASSSQVRAALREGAVEEAERLLTRPWAIAGLVQQGAQKGRTINFPTANIPLGDYLRPAFGVYAIRVRLPDGETRPGVANIGVKPTLGGVPEPLLEAHIFDFAGSLYGQELEVALLHFLRPEQRFETFQALRAQIILDAEAARGLLRA